MTRFSAVKGASEKYKGINNVWNSYTPYKNLLLMLALAIPVDDWNIENLNDYQAKGLLHYTLSIISINIDHSKKY